MKSHWHLAIIQIPKIKQVLPDLPSTLQKFGAAEEILIPYLILIPTQRVLEKAMASPSEFGKNYSFLPTTISPTSAATKCLNEDLKTRHCFMLIKAFTRTEMSPKLCLISNGMSVYLVGKPARKNPCSVLNLEEDFNPMATG